MSAGGIILLNQILMNQHFRNQIPSNPNDYKFVSTISYSIFDEMVKDIDILNKLKIKSDDKTAVEFNNLIDSIITSCKKIQKIESLEARNETSLENTTKTLNEYFEKIEKLDLKLPELKPLSKNHIFEVLGNKIDSFRNLQHHLELLKLKIDSTLNFLKTDCKLTLRAIDAFEKKTWYGSYSKQSIIGQLDSLLKLASTLKKKYLLTKDISSGPVYSYFRGDQYDILQHTIIDIKKLERYDIFLEEFLKKYTESLKELNKNIGDILNNLKPILNSEPNRVLTASVFMALDKSIIELKKGISLNQA